MDRLKKLKRFIVDSNLEGTQTFDTRNTVGDFMNTIYEEDGITLDYCFSYDYLEVFGLTTDEYKSLGSLLDIVY